MNHAQRIAAGTLFARGESVLLVHRAIYENGWDIPGALVSASESPADACQRQLREDLGVARRPNRLLVADWVPGAGGDEFLYVFDGGDLRDDDVELAVGKDGLDRWEWVPVRDLARYVPAELARRFAVAHDALVNGGSRYLERGKPVAPLHPRQGVANV